MKLARHVFILLNEDMEEDDVIALTSLYGAVSPRGIKSMLEWHLY